MNFIFFTILVVPQLGWDVVLSSLNEWDFTNDRWTESDGTTLINVKSCPSNGMKLLCLDGDIKQAETHITELPPHFELKVLADLYYVASFNYEYGKLKLDSTQVFSKVYGWDVNMTSYFNQCGSWGVINSLCIKTAAYTLSHAASSVWIYLSTNLNEAMPTKGFCFRNVQLFINPCHYSCLTCYGGLINNCQSCYDGSTPVSGKCPICINPNLFFQTSLSGCVQECSRTYYPADKTKLCQFNNRVSAESTSFDWPINVIPSSYDWNLYNNGVLQSQRYFMCLYFNLVGMYVKEEYITKSYTFSSTTRQIRLRVSHYMFNVWNQYSQIQLLMDGVQVSLIYMKDGLFRTINNNVIKNTNLQCSNLAINKEFYKFRTEQIIKITNLNPTFTFKSSQDLWSVRDIYVDIIVCSLYCSTCLDDQNCSICQASYYLYKGQCITSCPEFSTMSGSTCTDFDQETQYTSYLIKAFYSINSQDTETSLFNLISSSGTNFEKGNSIYFSYLKDRRIFGGALVWLNAKFGNTYSIPQPHYAVRVRMLVVLGDDFANGKFQYKLHTNSVVTLTRASAATSQSQQWGDIYDEYFYQVNTLVTHTTGSFDITVECIGDLAKAINQAFCGIANYFVTVLECQIFCDACTSVSTCSSWSTTTANFNPTTHQCYPGYSADYVSKTCVADPVCGNGILELNEQCDDGNSISADGCFNCQYQCSNFYPNCLNTYSNTCNFGYYLNQFDNICYPKCGDGIIVAEEQCEDENILPFDGCHRCMFSCQDACSECRNGRCYKCKTGWSLQNGKCQPICGNGILSGTEICDDANLYSLTQIKLVDLHKEAEDSNLISFGGCHECQFQCQEGCEHCQNGQCLKCKEGWVLNDVAFTCFTICGDGEAAGLEFCDDGNDIPLDGCYECHFQCQLDFLVCEFDKCQLTQAVIMASHSCSTFESCDQELGIYLEQQANQCISFCGDLIKALDEECDDGNLVPYDGCDKCLFSCDPLCTDCVLGVCSKCQIGYQLNDQKCKGLCGNGIQLVDSEECDDFNQIPRDGCTGCKIDPNYVCILVEMGASICYTCPKNCQFCDQFECKQCQPSYFMNQGICLSCGDKCEECEGTPNNCIGCVYEGCKLCESRAGYYSNLEDKSCYSKCGDNIVSEGEQCDDGNINPNDGCDSQCQLEGNFKCGEFGCEEVQFPAISIEYINSTTTNTLLFYIQNSIIAGYCGRINLWIEQFKENEFNLSIKENILSNECEFIFEFRKTIEETNLIHVIVPIDFERRILGDATREIIIKPRKQVFYSESQIAQAQSVVAASEQFNLILKLIGPMTIVLGGFNFFLTILDILTWINNFYFINVDYPENVRMFFQQLEWGDIFMIPNFITLNSQQDDYYFEAPPKFVEKDVDPLFMNNIQLFIVLIGASLLVYLLSKIVVSLINKCYKVQKYTKNLAFYDLCSNKSINKKIEQLNKQKIPLIISKLKRECYSYSRNYRAIVMQIIGLVFLDQCLATILQLTNTSTSDYWIVKSNIIMAWLNLIFIGYIFYLNYSVSNSHEKLLENKVFISIFGSLYEEIDIKSGISRSYMFLNLIRKCLFIFFTVYYYDDPILQTSTCCGACFLNIMLLCYQNPFKSMQQLIKNGLPDLCIFLIILTTVGLAVDDQIKVLASDTKFTIGWIILSFIVISIMAQLIFLFQVFYQNFKARLRMVKNLIYPDQDQ